MAAPTGHMACAVCLAPSVSVRRSTVVSRVLACHCSLLAGTPALLALASNNAASAAVFMAFAAASEKQCLRRAQDCDSNKYMSLLV